MVAPRRRVARISDQSNVERRRSPCAADRFSETANAAASFGATWRFAGSSYNSARDRVLFRTWRSMRVLPRLAVGSLVLAIEVTSSGAVLRVQPTDFRRLPMPLPTSGIRGASPARCTVARGSRACQTGRRRCVCLRLAVLSPASAIEITSSCADLPAQPTEFRRLPTLLPTSESCGASGACSTVACDWHVFKRDNGCVSRSAAPYSCHTGRLVQYRATPISGCDRQVS